MIIKKLYKYNELMVNNIKWKYPEEEVVFQWTKRGLNGSKKDIKFQKAFCYTSIGFMLLVPLALATKADSFLDLVANIIVSLIFITPFILMIYFGILGGKVYRYKITSLYLEEASWRDEIAIMKAILKILLWIAFCFLLVFFMIDPTSLLVGLGGIIGIGVMAGVTLYSKDYAKTNLNYLQLYIPLESIFIIKVDNKRQLLTITGRIKEGTKRIKEFTPRLTLFCYSNNMQLILDYLKEKSNCSELKIEYIDNI